MIGENFKRGRERNKKSPPALESPDDTKEFLVMNFVIELCWDMLVAVKCNGMFS